ncbi:MAG TPA: sugar ABC transporter substrate-binding protein [Actinomycetes bacterium]|nr:sugar ABC transporter substrate-binding protein [Actinomycetes bacterium]
MRLRPSSIGRGARTLALATALTLGGAACIGGGGGSDHERPQPGQRIMPITPKEPTSPVTITFQSWVGEAQPMKKLVADFKKEHPNITVRLLNVPAERATQKLTTQIAGGNPPDTAFLDSSAVQDLAARRALVNLDGYIAGSEAVSLDDYVAGFKQTAVYQNSMFALPYDGETTGLFYRTDLFQAAGIANPPATWEELQTAAAKLTDPARKRYGYILFAPEAQYHWLPFLWQAGGNLLSQDGKTIAFNSPQGVQAADFYVGLRRYAPPDLLASDSWDGRAAFATGKVAMYAAGAWFGGEMASSYPRINGRWSVAPMPAGPVRCATTNAGDSLVVTSQSKNTDAAWLWIEFLSRPDNMKLGTFGTPSAILLPPRRSLLSDPQLGRYNPWLKGFAEQMACAVNETTTNPNWGQVSEALNAELGKAIYGDQSAVEALNKAAQKGQTLLEK